MKGTVTEESSHLARDLTRHKQPCSLMVHSNCIVPARMSQACYGNAREAVDWFQR